MKKSFHRHGFVRALSLCLALLFLTLGALPTAALVYPSPNGMDAALLYNVETASVLLEVEGAKQVSPGDTSRMMTALVAYKLLSSRLSESQTLTEDMVKNVEGYELSEGDKLSIRALFTIMLMRGANDATRALATVAGGGAVDGFVELMNQEAAALGMEDTVYRSPYPHEKDTSVTTARDTALLAAAFYGNGFLSSLASAATEKVTVNNRSITVHNRSAFDYDNGIFGYRREGIKGITVSDTADLLVASGKFDDLTYVAIVFGAPKIAWNSMTNSYNVPETNAYTLATDLLLFAKTGFESRILFNDYDIMGELPVTLSHQSDTVTVVPAEDVRCFLPKDDGLSDHLRYSIIWDVEELEAPVKLAEKVGTLQVLLDDAVVAEVDLVTNHAVSKSLLSELSVFLRYVLLHPVSLLVILALLAFAVYRLIASAKRVSAQKAGGVHANDEAPPVEAEEKSQE